MIWSSNPTPVHISRKDKNSKSKMYTHYKFIAAQFITTKTWKQPKCASTDECMHKEDVVYRYTKEYYLAMKKNEIVPFTATWMDLEIIILSEVSQTDKYYILICRISKNKTNELPYKTEIDSQT